MILYDGEELVLHYREGTADFLLVTFIGAYHEEQALERYLLKDFAEHHELPCLGITTKLRGFYLTPEIEEVAVAAGPVLARFRTILCIGHSMGGYAALKHAGLFRATHVVAMAPFYALDRQPPPGAPDDLPSRMTTMPGIVWKAEYETMSVWAGATKARLVALYDPSDPFDAFDIERYRRALPRLQAIPVFNAGHAIYDRLARPEIMSQLIHAVLSEDPSAARRQVYEFKRTQIESLLSLLFRAAPRHPVLTLQAVRSARVLANPDARRIHTDPLNNWIVYGLVMRGEVARAYAHFNWFLEQILGRRGDTARLQGPEDRTAIRDDTRYLLLTCHGSFVVYDRTTREIRLDHRPFTSEAVLPVFMRASGTVVTCHILLNGQEVPLPIGGDPYTAEWVPATAERIGIRTGMGYVSAVMDNRLEYDCDHLIEWESFVPLPVGDESPLVAGRATSWFERAAVSAATAPEAAGRPAAKASRWRKLFR